MAYKDSGEIATNSNYALGDYSFRIERTSVPGSSNDKIEAICTDKDGKNARKSIQVPSSTKISNWYVEANETEATVYVVAEDTGKVTKTFSENGCTVTVSNAPADIEGHYWTGSWAGSYYAELILISAYPLTGISISGGGQGDAGFSGSVYYNNRVFGGIPAPIAPVFPTTPTHNDSNIAEALWQGGGGDVKEHKTLLVGRFAIELGDAGGEGPGSDWDDPGDYDPDWEPDDPTHTLYVEVTGALSGRHNDPIVDPSYSYIPADKDTVKDYGCGGDGGHGGGGGAGASTVVVHKFATNQANSKKVTALAKRHGYGSGGGKGGKGGDGCILIYY